MSSTVRRLAVWILGSCGLFAGRCAAADEPDADIRQLKLRDWQPRSMLVTKQSNVERPAAPAVDVHNHLGAGKQFLTPERIAGYLTEMNAAGVRTVVNLDGGWGDRLKETLAALDESHPGRFLTFALVNFDGIDDDDWSRREAERLEESFRAGAKGLKFHKSFGLTHRYKNGKLVPVDDPKLDPIWQACAAQALDHDSHRRSRRVLHPARSLQRALARAERAPELVVLW